jgi:hypothetical protein
MYLEKWALQKQGTECNLQYHQKTKQNKNPLIIQQLWQMSVILFIIQISKPRLKDMV